MEETKENNDPANAEKRKGEDGFSWEEWTVIDEGDDPKNQSPLQPIKSSAASSDTSYSDIDNTSDAEEAREVLFSYLYTEIGLPDELLEQSPSLGNSEESVDQHNDESDGVSVITESDVDEGIADATGNSDVVFSNVRRADIMRVMEDADSMLAKVFIAMITISLIGGSALGAVTILMMQENRSIPTEPNLLNLKIERLRLLEQLKELNGALEGIKSNMLKERQSDTTKFDKPTENEEKTLPYVMDQSRPLDHSIKNKDSMVYERLQIFLRTICLVLEDVHQPNSNSETFKSPCETLSRFSDLKDLHKLLNTVINGLEPSEKSTHQRFLQNVDFQINSISDSLLTDLTRAFDKLSVKNQKKLAKIGFKLNERLCLLRNTLTSDSNVRESLGKNNTFFDNCDEIAAKKSEEKPKEIWKRAVEASTRPQPRKDKEKNSEKLEAPINPNFNKKSRGFFIKRQNATSPYENVEARKCYSNNLPSFMHDSQDPENSCAMLMAPPRSNWKLKQNSFKLDSGKGQKDKRRKLIEEWPGKFLMKGDRGASKIWKKATKVEKCPKASASSHENDDKETIKRMKEKLNEKIRSGAVLSEPPSNNAEKKYKRTYPPTSTVHRVKKSFDKENNEFIVVERRDTNSKPEGSWQFERRSYRSRMRDNPSNDDPTGNWYFDRVGNRKNARLNCDNGNQDSRCGKLYH